MKYLIVISIILASLISCNSNKTTISNNSTSSNNDTIRIANDELEYEIIIFEIGFKSWLPTQPPMGHYGLNYLESNNRLFVLEYNNRDINFK